MWRLSPSFQCKGSSERTPEAGTEAFWASWQPLSTFFTVLPQFATAFITAAHRVPRPRCLGTERSQMVFHFLGSSWGHYAEFQFSIINLNTLIISIIFFLPCVISPLGAKGLCAKLQSSWMAPQHGLAACRSPASQRSRLHEIINAWMWSAHKWGAQVIRRKWRKIFFYIFAELADPVLFFFLFSLRVHIRIALFCPSSSTNHGLLGDAN